MSQDSRSGALRREFSAGWRVLLAAALGSSVATTAIPLYSMGVFIEPLEIAKGWSRTDVTTAATIFGFCLPFSILLIGHSVERIGVRSTVVLGHVMLGLAFFGLSRSGNSLEVFWGLHALAALLAAGASPVAYTRAVIRHFDEIRGLAIGIFMASAGLGAALAPPLLDAVIRGAGWESGYRALGVTLLAVAVVVFWLLRDIDDNSPATEPGSRQPNSVAPENAVGVVGPAPPRVTLAVICMAIFAVALSVNGYVVHFIPLLRDEGMTAGDAAMVASYIGVSVILGRLVTGALMDRVSVGLIGFFVFATAASGIVLLQIFGSAAALICAIAVGFTVGAEVDLVTYMVSRTFEPARFSRNFSWVYSAFMIGGGLSPLLAAYIYDTTGSYGHFFSLTATLLMTISLGFIGLHRMQRIMIPDSRP
jgi:MFS family permease